MLKVFTYLFICFYFLLSIGVSANFHFCKSGLKSITLNSLEKKSCCKIKGKSCKFCKDLSLSFKKSGLEKITIQDDFQVSSPVFIAHDFVQIYTYKSPYVAQSVERNIVFHPPPGKNSYPKQIIQFCNFRI